MRFIRRILAVFLVFVPLLSEAQIPAGQVLSAVPVEEKEWSKSFEILKIDDATFARMQRGGSFPSSYTIKRDDLRYLRLLHYNFSGQVQVGELVCNKAIADDLLAIFKELFRQKYEINKMVLIDDYKASDEASMEDNNTSAFCFRRIAGATTLSKHAQGLAIDINPLNNPSVKYAANGSIAKIEPDTPEARKNAPRSPKKAHAITRDDLCYKLFAQYGFTWGGAWRSKKDYQHFQK